MNKIMIFLLSNFFCVGAMHEVKISRKAEVALARKSACFFIQHTAKKCILVRVSGSKVMKECRHDECLKENLKLNNGSKIFYFYDENKKPLNCPLVVVDCSEKKYQKLCMQSKKTLNPQIKPKAMCAEITLKQDKPIVSFYDKNKLWILDYECNKAFFESKLGKIMLTQIGRQKLADQVDLSNLVEIKNKTSNCVLV